MRGLARFFFQSIFTGLLLSATLLSFVKVPPGQNAILERVDQKKPPVVLTPGNHFIPTWFVPNSYTLYLLPAGIQMQKIETLLSLKYGDYLDLPDAYRIRLQFKLHYSLLPDNAPRFLHSILGGNPSLLPGIVAEKAGLIIRAKFPEMYKTSGDIPFLFQRFHNYISEDAQTTDSFQNQLAAAFSIDGKQGIKIEKVEILEIAIPDAARYEQQLASLLPLQQARTKALISKIENEAQRYAANKNLETETMRAEKYAQLIRKYPELLEFLRIDKLAPQASVIYEAPRVSQEGPQRPELLSPEITNREREITPPESSILRFFGF